MKVILAGVAFAALMASPLFAQSQSAEQPLYSRTFHGQKKQSRIEYRGLDGSARKSDRPTQEPDPRKQWPCSTALGFCPDYHGGNG